MKALNYWLIALIVSIGFSSCSEKDDIFEEPFEPQTITLSDTVLRGIQCKPGRAGKVVDAVSDTG